MRAIEPNGGRLPSHGRHGRAMRVGVDLAERRVRAAIVMDQVVLPTRKVGRMVTWLIVTVVPPS